MTERSVVVLGAGGFLGGHISNAFEATGATVIRVTRTPRPGANRRFVSLDLVEAAPGELNELLTETRADVIVNGVGTVWQSDERRMLRTNAEFVRKLVPVATALPGRPRVVHLGSVYEYGAAPAGTNLTEEHPTSSTTAYGRTKSLGSLSVLEAGRSMGFNGLVLRLSTVCGPGASPESLLGMVAEELARRMRSRDRDASSAPLRLTPLRSQRDFVDVRDVAAAVLAAAAVPEADVTGRAFNIARGESVPVRHLVDRMITLSGLPVRVVEEAGPWVSRSDNESQRIDISRAVRHLNWRPRHALDESLRELLTAACRKQAPHAVPPESSPREGDTRR